MRVSEGERVITCDTVIEALCERLTVWLAVGCCVADNVAVGVIDCEPDKDWLGEEVGEGLFVVERVCERLNDRVRLGLRVRESVPVLVRLWVLLPVIIDVGVPEALSEAVWLELCDCDWLSELDAVSLVD